MDEEKINVLLSVDGVNIAESLPIQVIVWGSKIRSSQRVQNRLIFFNKWKSRGNDLLSHISRHFFQMSHFPTELINIYIFKCLLIFLHFFRPRLPATLEFWVFTFLLSLLDSEGEYLLRFFIQKRSNFYLYLIFFEITRHLVRKVHSKLSER